MRHSWRLSLCPALPFAAVVALAAGGCNQSPQSAAIGTQDSTSQDSAVTKIAARPTATPTPTPDAHKIANWAQGRVLNEVPVRSGNKVFALTFDDGPWPIYTRQILRILKENNVKATFFMVGSVVREYPKIAREVVAQGHAVGSHSWSHPSRPRNAVAEIQKTNVALREIGVRNTMFRPPYGLLKNGMAQQALKEKQAVFIWSADSHDWKKPGARRIANAILNQATPGGIALMHDGGGAREGTVAALPIIISELKARGYKLVTVPELLKHRYIVPPKPKKVDPKKAGKSKAPTVASATQTPTAQPSETAAH